MWNRTENQMTLTLIRHGKTKANQEHRYLGRTDEELSEEGKKEVLEQKAAGRYPALEDSDVVIISPMERCRQTAELLYPEREPLVIEEFREMDFGVFEGKNYKELRGDARYQAWIDSEGILPFPEGESLERFQKRCCTGFLRMLARLEEMDSEKEAVEDSNGGRAGQTEKEAWERWQKGTAVVHGGTIMALLSAYGEGAYFDYQCENGGGYECEVRWRRDLDGALLPESVAVTHIRRF